MMRFALPATLFVLLVSPIFSGDAKEDAAKLEERYQQLLKSRPALRRKVESGEVTQAQIIARLRTTETGRPAGSPNDGAKGQDRRYRDRRRKSGKKGQDRRYRNRRRTEVKDPAGYQTKGKQIFSGPQKGEKLPALKVTSLFGDTKGKAFDLIKRAGNRPQILFFQDAIFGEVPCLFQFADAIRQVNEKTEEEVQIACIFLADDTNAITSRYARIFGGLRERGVSVIAVAPGGRNGPGSYGLNRNIAQTILVAKDGKVTWNFVSEQGLLFADPHILGAVAEVVGEKHETVAAWLNATGSDDRVRANEERARRQRELRTKLGEFVEAGKLTRKEAGELYRAAFGDGADRRSR
ncbi:MAG: hypothetical protein CMJ70_24315 [Planctomycetaceae bacterium]|nr:hypothetical protein [Planctomycetaceae bacterium]